MHKSVMQQELLDLLKIKPGCWYLDATLGAGGDGLKILQSGGKLVGLDQDSLALELSKELFESQKIEPTNYKLIKGNFGQLTNLTDQRFAGIIFDLGVSSMQLDDGDRGFSFSKEAKLDMRMDREIEISAYELINGLTRFELEKMLMVYGDIGNAKILARLIVEARQIKPITTTLELANIVSDGRKESKIHPATRVFQALRIAVNDEINNLKLGLSQAFELLEQNGVLSVISFHSGEDRVVKRFFKDLKMNKQALVNDLMLPVSSEITNNPRSRSAKLRSLIKL